MDPRLLTADQLGSRLEVVNGLPIWEAQPFPIEPRAGFRSLSMRARVGRLHSVFQRIEGAGHPDLLPP